MILESLKKDENLPYVIRYKRCLDHIDNCKQHHEETIVEKFDSQKNSFSCKIYGMHNTYSNNVMRKEDTIKELILASTQRRINTIKKILKELKLYDYTKVTMNFRVTSEEKEEIRERAKAESLSVSEYIRKKVFVASSG